MATYKDNVDRLEIVAEGLGDLLNEVIFIGGSVLQFYSDNPLLNDYRPTKDVDCLMKIYSYVEFNAYSEKLRGLGFKHDLSENAPICRWNYKGTLVDTIPDAPTVLGFSEVIWFKEGRGHAIEQDLPSGKIIKILPFPFMIATKLVAWQERGEGDFLGNHDLEDIITVIDSRESLEEILEAPNNVKEFISNTFNSLLRSNAFKRAIPGHIGFDSTATERAKNVILKMEEIVKTLS